MAQAAGSSQVQVIFIPPWHFSIFIVQRGTMTMFGIMGVIPVIEPGIPIPGIDIPVPAIGFIIAVTMIRSFFVPTDFSNWAMSPRHMITRIRCASIATQVLRILDFAARYKQTDESRST
jgi:hypothetical protein